MKKDKTKPVETPKPFTLAEYSVLTPCVCPACGGSMVPAEYYIAAKGEVRTTQDWSHAGKVTTITTMKYHNIRKRIGGFCPNCYTKSRKPGLNLYMILAGVVGAIAITCIVLFILFLTSPSFKQSAPGAGAIGLIGGLIAVYYTAKHLINGSNIRSHLKQIKSVEDSQFRSDHISEAFVVSAQIPLEPGEVILSSERVRNMQKFGM
ncbi:MAG: hypothetical protein ABFC73_10005 [Clostridiaceae bacterium]